MKIGNLRKKIGATLLAAGMITPAAAHAAGINFNLLLDPSFEFANEAGPSGPYDTKGLFSWSDGTQIGSTYRYDQDFDKPNDGDNDPDLNPPQPGLRYFSANYPNANEGAPINTDTPGQVMQVVDVSGGDSAAAIAAGAEYWISGYFGAYGASGTETAVLYVDFLDGGDASLGTASVTGNSGEWNFASALGPIPVGTATVEVSVFTEGVGVGGSRYIDNANFTIFIPEPSTVLLAGIGIMGAGAFSRKRKA